MVQPLMPLANLKTNKMTIAALALISALTGPAFGQNQDKALPQANTPSVLHGQTFIFQETLDERFRTATRRSFHNR